MSEIIIASESTESLRSRLSSLLARSAEDLSEMAALVHELESRGEDLSGLRIGLVGYLRRIAAGTLLPEAVIRFAASPRLLDQVSTLPLSDQRRLANGDPVEIAVWSGERIDSRRFDPLALTAQQRGQVFGPGEIRSLDRQIPLLTHADTLRRAKPAPRVGSVRADRATGQLLINRREVDPAEILTALAQLSDPTPPASEGDALTPVMVRLTSEQHRRLKVYCARYSLTIGEVVEQSLAATGVFRLPS